MSRKDAAVFGGTGAVGKHLVTELLQSSDYSNIHAFVRKPFKASSAHKDSTKLIEHIIDFDKLLQEDADTIAQIKNVKAEAVYITCALYYYVRRA
jgi:oxidoreductase